MFRMIAAFVLVVLSQNVCIAAGCGCEYRRSILMDFYNATGGPTTWKRHFFWSDPAKTVCEWCGVNCTEADVTSIDLASNGLSGSIPLSFAKLTSLVSVDLHDNHLLGGLESFFTGTSLKFLILSDNNFSGELPLEWASPGALNIVKLDVSNNNLCGTISPLWARWKRLSVLDLSNNSFSGTLPAAWSNWSSLSVLNLNFNFIVGTLPSSWQQGGALNLTVLQLWNNSISGTLPDVWNLEHIRLIDLDDNMLSGSLPPLLWSRNAAHLETLYISRNRLSGALPVEWARLPVLSNLLLGGNRLSGTLPPEWSHVTSLQSLGLEDNLLAGELPSAWKDLGSLTFLVLGGNALVGGLPPEWGGWDGDAPNILTTLEVLDISDNCMNGTVPDSWLAALNVSRLRINNCNTSVERSIGTNSTDFVDIVQFECEGAQVWPRHCIRSSDSISAGPSSSRTVTVLATPSSLRRSHLSQSISKQKTTSAGLAWSQSKSSTVSASLLIPASHGFVTLAMITAASAPLPITAVFGAFSGVDAGAAQALTAVLMSPCSCGSELFAEHGGTPLTLAPAPPRAASMALSPLVIFADQDAVGPFEAVVFNVCLAIGTLLFHFTIAFFHDLWTSRTEDDIGSSQQKGEVFQRIACTPSGALLRFPNYSIKTIMFLAPGVSWSVAGLLSQSIGGDDSEPLTRVAGGCVMGLVFLCAIVVMLYRVVFLKWIKSPTAGLEFYRFGNLSPPIPRRLASLVCSREGQWGPAGRRQAFGSPIATPFLPWCVRWAWAIGPLIAWAGIALSVVRPASSRRDVVTKACDALQGVQITMFGAGAIVFAWLLPHRTVLKSMLSSMCCVVNAAVLLLGTLCRGDYVSQSAVIIVATVMSLVGSIVVLGFERYELRLLNTAFPETRQNKGVATRHHVQSRAERGALLCADKVTLLTRIDQSAALKTIIELICAEGEHHRSPLLVL
jgi:hypothetical protein